MKRFGSRCLAAAFGLLPAASVFAMLLFVSTASAHERHHDEQDPPLPAELQVPAGNEVAFCATGVGVQIYVWRVNASDPTLSAWVLKAPHALLFQQREVAGIHFAGPSWENNDGSKVTGKRVASATVDPNAIPWLLLQASSTLGAGLFADITYIQRLNTHGGLAPSAPGTADGQEVLVPYIAEYVFYHAKP